MDKACVADEVVYDCTGFVFVHDYCVVAANNCEEFGGWVKFNDVSDNFVKLNFNLIYLLCRLLLFFSFQGQKL